MGGMRTRGCNALLMAVAAVWFAAPAEAYYHYVYYLNGSAPGTPTFARFNLAALPNKTVTFLVADSGPASLAPNDNFASVLTQVKQAAQVWNSVASSDLRVAFGGVQAANQSAHTPGGDVVFIDLPPGLLGMGTPSLPATPTAVSDPNGAFIPFVRSTVMLTNDTSLAPGPSYLESFFTTAVHEMGHALGLQHTFTAAAMATTVGGRNTSRTRPIDADDIAGISLLYGNAGYAAKVGSIAGRVTSNGQGVALASVVALSSAGPAISTLTNPDGTYEIDNLPPNQYWVYVHPIPPDADIKGPFDAAGNAIAASGPVETLFYPGTRDPLQFGVIPVRASAMVTGIDFSVAPRANVPVYDMATYSYSGQMPVSPAIVNTSMGLSTIAAQAVNPVSTPIPQSVSVPGYSNAGVRPYGSPVALALDLASPMIIGTGPRHILFNFGNDLYVLPDGLVLVKEGPPAITSVTPKSDGTVTIAGANFGPDSQVYFDGLPSTVSTPFSGVAGGGSITVTPPPGYAGQTASIIVYNGDGQNSTFYQAQAPPTYVYPGSGTPQITVTPAALPAGSVAQVDVTSANLQFVDGQVTLGFGTSDISIQRVWTLSPNHLIANVAVAPGATLGTSDVSVISGFQTAVLPLGFQTQPANAALPTIAGVVNADQFQENLSSGAYGSVYGSNLAVAPASAQVTLNDQPVPILFTSAGQVNFAVPAGLPIGLAVLKLFNGSSSALPIVVQIDAQAPVISGVSGSQGPLLSGQKVSAGDLIVVTVSGVDPSVAGSLDRIHATMGGVDTPVLQVAPASTPGAAQVFFRITQSFGGAAVPLVITVDSNHTDPYTITVQ